MDQILDFVLSWGCLFGFAVIVASAIFASLLMALLYKTFRSI